MTLSVRSRRVFSPLFGLGVGLVATLSQGCGLIEVRGVPGVSGKTATSAANGPSTTKAPERGQSSGGREAPPFDAARYETCAAEFEKEYDAWLPVDAEAKAVLAKVKRESAYVSIPAVVRAYAVVEEKRAVRQDGRLPPGASFAPATKVELVRALMRIGVENGTDACVDRQLNYDPRSPGFRPPLTGDRAKD